MSVNCSSRLFSLWFSEWVWSRLKVKCLLSVAVVTLSKVEVKTKEPIKLKFMSFQRRKGANVLNIEMSSSTYLSLTCVSFANWGKTHVLLQNTNKSIWKILLSSQGFSLHYDKEYFLLFSIYFVVLIVHFKTNFIEKHILFSLYFVVQYDFLEHKRRIQFQIINVFLFVIGWCLCLWFRFVLLINTNLALTDVTTVPTVTFSFMCMGP